MRISLLLWNNYVAFGQLVTVLALGSLVRTLPSPSVELVLHSIQKELASNDGILGHIVSSSPRILIKINLLLIFLDDLALLPLQTLGSLKQRGQQSSCSLVILLLLLGLMRLTLPHLSTTSLVSMLHLVLNLFDVAKGMGRAKVRSDRAKVVEVGIEMWFENELIFWSKFKEWRSERAQFILKIKRNCKKVG